MCAVIRDHEVKGRRVEIKKAIAREEINKDGRRGGGRGHGGMRDGRGGDFRSKIDVMHIMLQK